MRRTLLKLAVALLYAALLVITPIVYHWRPLLPASGLRANYVEGPTRFEARVYRMLFRSRIVFIEIPARDKWFAVDLDSRRVVRPTVAPDQTPYLHYNQDMNLGVPVDDTLKHDDFWTVTWGAGEVTWSYADVTVRLRGT